MMNLTPRETEVVTLLVEGMTLQKAADHLHIGYATAKEHLNSAHKRLGVTSRAGLCAVVHEQRHAELLARYTRTLNQNLKYRTALEHIAKDTGSLGFVASKALR
jgi:DNA-binding CsgD family transcriptional regulator